MDDGCASEISTGALAIEAPAIAANRSGADALTADELSMNISFGGAGFVWSKNEKNEPLPITSVGVQAV